MNTLIKTADIRIAYKVTIWLLLSNNIAGIALNPIAFFYSIVFLLGIPGAGFLIHYIISASRKEPVMVLGIHLSAILYNYLIYHALGNVIKNTNEEIIGGTTWPELNIILSAMALLLCLINSFLNPTNNYEN